MTPIIGPDSNIYCTIECLRRTLGVIANPLRLAMHFEFDDYCHGCNANLAQEVEC
jgi:hypothetical protein